MALFELKQDYGNEAEGLPPPPTFKDCAAADIDTVFFNGNEHADRHIIDGKDVLVVIVEGGTREHNSHWEAKEAELRHRTVQGAHHPVHPHGGLRAEAEGGKAAGDGPRNEP